jgi:hypothetical protein
VAQEFVRAHEGLRAPALAAPGASALEQAESLRRRLLDAMARREPNPHGGASGTPAPSPPSSEEKVALRLRARPRRRAPRSRAEWRRAQMLRDLHPLALRCLVECQLPPHVGTGSRAWAEGVRGLGAAPRTNALHSTASLGGTAPSPRSGPSREGPRVLGTAAFAPSGGRGGPKRALWAEAEA